MPDDVVHIGDFYDTDVVGASGAGIKPVLLLRGRIIPLYTGCGIIFYSEPRDFKSGKEFPCLIRFGRVNMMEPATIDIKQELETFLSTAYPALFREYLFFTTAMVISCVIIPIFLAWMLNRHDRKLVQAGSPYKAYTHRNKSKLGIHYTVMLLMPVLAGRRLLLYLRSMETLDFFGREIIVFNILLVLLAIWAAWGLFRFRVLGLVSTGVFMLCYAACEQYQLLFAVVSDMDGRTKYTTVEQYTLYIVSDYLVTQSMAISLAALIVLALLTIYYYKRRFLFMPGKLGGPLCEHCGQIVSRGNDFCTSCGKQLRLNPIKQVITPLDNTPFCGKCGTFTNSSDCPKCSGTILDCTKKTAKEGLHGLKLTLSRGLAFVVVLVVVLVCANDPTWNLQRGSANASNALVQVWDDFYADPGKASDPVWLSGFDSAAGALYQVDARWYFVKPRSVQSNNLAFLVVYADASFKQMEILEQCVDVVHSAAQGEISSDEISAQTVMLQNGFNNTIDLQRDAMRYVGSVSPDWDMFGKVGYICVDTLRAILLLISITLVSIVFLAGCTFMLLYLLNEFSPTEVTGLELRLQNAREKAASRIEKYAPRHSAATPADVLRRISAVGKECWHNIIRITNEAWMLILQLVGIAALLLSLLRPKNIGGCAHWIKGGLTDLPGGHAGSSAAYRREQRLTTLLAVIVVAIIIAISIFHVPGFPASADSSSNKQEYLTAAKAAAIDYATDISNALMDICGTGNLTEEDRLQLYSLIDAQIAADQTILSYDMTDLDNYQDLHTGLRSLCTDDISALKLIRADIENGVIPSQELQLNYANIRGAYYVWVFEDIASRFTEIAVEIAFGS